MRTRGPRIPARDRFEMQYNRAGKDECWNWTYSTSALGYGRFFYKGKSRIASRMAYIFEYGPIYDDAYILHSCDNPACVNPSHLRVGTLADNSQDQIARGRCFWQKISPERNARISEMLLSGEKLHREIAKVFGISRGHVTNLARKFRSGVANG